ncbi:betaine lipid synthase [Pseudohyphozyma bogoriensis]|nr:betaine lipid synthase [Pseudohyphozyma bogoriensis]
MSRYVYGALATGLVVGYNPIKHELARLSVHPITADYVLLASFLAVVVAAFASPLSVAWQFAYNCFFRPLGKSADQAGRLNKFYEKQAEIYDRTRSRLLRGRTTMLKLSAAHLREQRRTDPKKRLIWLDIGGGTGWNVEEMDKYMPMAEFDAVYVLDLCGPLLEQAKKRFAARGWKNVHCLLQDATTFVLPEWEQNGVDPDGALDFVTMSYSLSMMPDFYTLLDRVNQFLTPNGLFSVCDFYVSSREKTSVSEIIGDVVSRQCGWLTRMFWMTWFEFDHVDLHPSRRHYLEHSFATIKSYNGRNRFILPWVIKIPYYVTLCTSRRTDTSSATQAYEIDAGNTISASASPLLVPVRSNSDLPELNLGAALSRNPSVMTGGKRLKRSSSTKSDSARIDIAPEGALSAFHYGFTWEDPAVDMQHMNFTKDDHLLCITSAGDNALHYAIEAKPKRIHAVDMNPCQGHLLELKLAAINALSYDEFWQLFGDGKHADFRTVLDTKLSPFLTSHAYQFWRQNDQSFASSFYLRGYSGWALRLAKFAIRFARLDKEVHAFCSAKTLEEQRAIWEKDLRPVLLSSWIVNLFLSNQAFLWNALGVPSNQAKMFLDETSTRNYANDTLDPVAHNTHINSGAYHYQVCLEQKFTRNSCPLYLTREAFEFLKKNNGKALDCFRLHTDSVVSVMKQLGPSSLTIAVLMDLQDWFNNSLEYSEDKLAKSPCELTVLIKTLHKALKPGGRVFWRSAAIKPWYAELYRREGFKVECIHARPIGGLEPIDRVNMYASFYKAVKI